MSVPRYNVVSLRLSDEELDKLSTLVVTEKKSISTILREALNLYIRTHQ